MTVGPAEARDLLSPGELLLLTALAITQLDRIVEALSRLWSRLRGVPRQDMARARRMVEEAERQESLNALAALVEPLGRLAANTDRILAQLMPEGAGSVRDIAIAGMEAAQRSVQVSEAAARAATRAEAAAEETREAMRKRSEASDAVHRSLFARLEENEREAAGLPRQRRIGNAEVRDDLQED